MSAGGGRDMSMKVLAVGAQKGGVGKTTTAIYLAARAAELFGGTAERAVVGLINRDESQNLATLVRMRPESCPWAWCSARAPRCRSTPAWSW